MMSIILKNNYKLTLVKKQDIATSVTAVKPV